MAARRSWTTAAALALLVGASPRTAGAAGQVYDFGVLPQVSAEKLAEMWEPFLARLSTASGVQLRFVTAPTLAEFTARADAGAYAFYYHNTLAYVQQDELYKAFAREVGAKTVGLVVVAKDGPIQGLSDLKGKKVLVPSATSFGAAVLPLFFLQRVARLDLKKDVTVGISGSHEAGYQAVLQGQADAAGGLTRTLELLPAESRARLRILFTTRPFSPLPFAARKDVPAEVVARVQKAMAEFARDPASAPILEALDMKEGFEAATPSDWDDVRTARKDLLKVSGSLTGK